MRLKRDMGIVMNHKKIQRIKKKYHLFTKIRRINPYKTVMKKTQEHRTCQNVLNRQFTQEKPFRAFGTDITYLQTKYKMIYLSTVKDFASKEIVAWGISEHINMDLVTHTILQMKDNLKHTILTNSLIHSDQGFHYTNPLYISMIKQMNMVQSMSRKGKCIDNAPTESFFGHLKDELEYKTCTTFTELKKNLTQYMHYYNHNRPQWNLNKMTPVEYRDHLLSA